MSILNIAGYKFIALNDLQTLRENFFVHCQSLALKGTILLSPEGININLAGAQESISSFIHFLNQDSRFSHMRFHESLSASQAFKRLKVKLKKEIITMRQSAIRATNERAPSLAPEIFKQWLDEKRDITVLDTRNDYEVRFGTFNDAVNLHIDDFTSFPDTLDRIDQAKPIVMFCTGGIRCEKAALYLLSQGYKDVYQLDGGILGYFAKVGGDHYDGECFVFDERVALNSHLNETETKQCLQCQGPILKAEQQINQLLCSNCR